MRNPDRIDEFCSELAELWKTSAPDWRFGQLICNAFGQIYKDPFFIEEDEMLKYLKAYFGDENG
jgi:hypothetical protein